jgi:hypothetical protein
VSVVSGFVHKLGGTLYGEDLEQYVKFQELAINIINMRKKSMPASTDTSNANNRTPTTSRFLNLNK